MEYWTAFIMGLVGSTHCIGMCGPIAMALPYKSNSKLSTLKNIFLYNGGRVISYGVIGIIPGLLGLSFSITGHQKLLSIFLGVLFIGTALFSFSLENKLWSFNFIQRIGFKVQNKLRELLKQKEHRTFIGIGIVNGFLPCGLVYMAVAGALIQSNVLHSMSYMVFFGLGTIPLMLLIAMMGNVISIKIRNFITKLTPIFMLLMGCYFIYRGLNVDLPENILQWMDKGTEPICH